MPPYRYYQTKFIGSRSSSCSDRNKKEYSKTFHAKKYSVNCFDGLQAINLFTFFRKIHKKVRFPFRLIEAEYIDPDANWTIELLIDCARKQHEQINPLSSDELKIEEIADFIFILNGKKNYPLYFWD